MASLVTSCVQNGVPLCVNLLGSSLSEPWEGVPFVVGELPNHCVGPQLLHLPRSPNSITHKELPFSSQRGKLK